MGLYICARAYRYTAHRAGTACACVRAWPQTPSPTGHDTRPRRSLRARDPRAALQVRGALLGGARHLLLPLLALVLVARADLLGNLVPPVVHLAVDLLERLRQLAVLSRSP